MLLALVLCFDYRKSRDTVNLFELHSSKGHKYIWYALPGYAIGLVTALAAGVLTHSPQPALLYLVLLFSVSSCHQTSFIAFFTSSQPLLIIYSITCFLNTTTTATELFSGELLFLISLCLYWQFLVCVYNR